MRALLALLLAAAPSFGATQTLACAVPHPGGDRVLLVTFSWDTSDLSLIDPISGQVLASKSLFEHVTGLCVGPSGVVLQTAHSLFLRTFDLAKETLLSSSDRNILRVVPFEKGWLVLSSKGTRDGRPAGGLVHYLRPVAPSRAGRGLGVGVRRLDLLARYNFWDVQVGDADGDGRADIALCTWSKTRIIPKYAQRYFIYGWDGRDVYPRWRGSRLSKPYLQARLVRLGAAPQTRLLAVEETRSGRRCLTAYRWNDFGFTGLADGDEHDALSIIDSPGLPALVRVRDARRGWLARVEAVDGRIALRELCALAADDIVVLGRFDGRAPEACVMKPDGKIARIVALLPSPPSPLSHSVVEGESTIRSPLPGTGRGVAEGRGEGGRGEGGLSRRSVKR